jgi:ribosomal protein L37AE/L43A
MDLERSAATRQPLTHGMSGIQPPQANGYPRCPVCSSWDVQRHSEMFRVWFTCRRCGAVFGG